MGWIYSVNDDMPMRRNCALEFNRPRLVCALINSLILYLIATVHIVSMACKLDKVANTKKVESRRAQYF